MFLPPRRRPCCADGYDGRMIDKQKFVAATQWLRPFTRWSARFAHTAPSWVPGFVRHLPLKLVNRVLRGYHRLLQD